jgi:hypothetical protein
MTSEEGFADIAKSGGPDDVTVNDMDTACAVVLPAPLTVIVYAPRGVELEVMTNRVEIPVPLGPSVTLDGEIVVAGPAGETVDVRVIVPVNPLTLVAIMVEVPD